MKQTLSEVQRLYLLKLARQSVAQTLGKTAVARKPDLDAELDFDAATFVTLTEEGELRGCIGSLQASRNIVDDVIQAARSAAFHDPRFAPIRAEELTQLHFEISVLTEPEPLNFDTEAQLLAQIKPGVDGLLIEHNGKHATFLPQVWQQLPDPLVFLHQLMLKAGIDPTTSLTELSVQHYQVIDFHE